MKRVHTAALLGAAFLLGLLAARPIWDVDIFWHIAAGNWILDHLRLPATDIFSYRQNAPEWHSFQWLYEILVALVARAGGLAAVRVFHGVVTGLALAAFARLAVRYLSTDSGLGDRSAWPRALPGIAALLVALLFALYADRVRARPHVFNLLFWSLLLDLVLVSGLRRWAAWVAAAAWMLLWSTIHAGGSFIFLVAALAFPVAASATAALTGAGETRWSTGPLSPRRAWAFWGMLLAVCLAAPDWLNGVVQAWSMLGGSELLIDEWLPFWHYFAVATHPVHYLAAMAPLAMLGIWVLAVVRGRSRRLDITLLSLGLVFLPYRSARFVFFEALALLLVWPMLRSVPWRAGRARHWRRSVVWLTCAALLAGTLHFHSLAQFGSLSRTVDAWQENMDTRRFPVEFGKPLEILAEAKGKPLHIFCLPNWGGYLLYKHYPRVRVVADGRGNFPLEVGQALKFIYLHRWQPRYGRAVERIYSDSGADVVVMQRPAFPAGYEPAGWRRLIGNGKGEIWVRSPAQ